MLEGMLMNARFLNVLPQGLWVGRDCLTDTEYVRTSDIYQLQKTVFYFITNSIRGFVSVYLFQVMSSLRLSATWVHPRCLDIMFVTLKKKEGKLRTLTALYS